MLRPAFMKQLADHLLAGESVNLYAPHGRGRRQTLEDMLPLLAGVQVQKIDLKREQNKWGSWFKETLTLSGQVIVIIHNIEYVTQAQKAALSRLKVFTLLCVSELPMGDKDMLEVEIPELV
ncbi:hypothetical protein [Ghiorsea bivora]|uniref:hypothetical protein n=1 Tax=Ghiorsea bivora TaxID=1485545 RepID=UPI000571CB3D|nr:hypothetical protein [Ghiorsea bivora]